MVYLGFPLVPLENRQIFPKNVCSVAVGSSGIGVEKMGKLPVKIILDTAQDSP